MFERRAATRRSTRVFFNKYLGGYPHLSRTLDVSKTGILAQTLIEPDQQPPSFPIELRLPGDAEPVWFWVRGVWRRGREQALQFVSGRSADVARLERYVAHG